jgi:hypothetical protein
MMQWHPTVRPIDPDLQGAVALTPEGVLFSAPFHRRDHAQSNKDRSQADDQVGFHS